MPDMPDMPGTPGKPWYQEGLRFSCTMCGNCCTGGPGAVWFTDTEAKAMARALGISDTEFASTYTRTIGSRHSLNEHETEHGFDCVFLDRTSRPGAALCRVYLARPSQCSTWPFWPDNLRTRGAWERAKAATPCPGMGQGNLVSVDQIRIMRDKDQTDNGTAPW